jgi:hypothetical protein
MYVSDFVFCRITLNTCIMTHRFLLLLYKQLFRDISLILFFIVSLFAAALFCCSVNITTRRPVLFGIVTLPDYGANVGVASLSALLLL